MATALGTTPRQATWTATASGFAYAAGLLLAGPLSDRYGPRAVITTGLVAAATSTTAVSVAPDPPTVIVLRGLPGLTAAVFAPSALSYVAQHIAPQRRSAAAPSSPASPAACPPPPSSCRSAPRPSRPASDGRRTEWTPMSGQAEAVAEIRPRGRSSARPRSHRSSETSPLCAGDDRRPDGTPDWCAVRRHRVWTRGPPPALSRCEAYECLAGCRVW
ncbi:MFS transporter [Streptomyces sp. enrichment culture]|uniref:MFS transporter n=1 Tax=Streptomyces sp. enrichment culture TaxID=1795815 RepID=UPI003F57EC6B